MQQRIIFIDIDGVLLPTRMWAASANMRVLTDKVPLGDRAPMLRFDPGAVGLLVRLCKLTGAKLVLASNWRMTWQHGVKALRAKLTSEGLGPEFWHDHWQILETESRIELAYADWLDQQVMPTKALIINDKAVGSIVLQEKTIAQIRPAIGEIRTHIDDGLGIAEYRAGLTFFGVNDRRLPRGDREATCHLVSIERIDHQTEQAVDREPPKALLAMRGQSTEVAEAKMSQPAVRPFRSYSP